MTMPITRILPPVPDFKDLEEAKKYLHDLTFELQSIYTDSVQNINGSFRSYADVDGTEWVPTISSLGTQGTIGYTLQSGFSRRSGIMTEIWFDIAWESIGASTGTIIVDLPYKTSTYSGIPFTIPIITETMIFAPYSTVAISANTDSYTASLVKSGSGIANTLGLAIEAVGRIRGYLIYIGVEDE